MERQYIGARYVPKFSDPIEWNKALSYEAMTIATYLGNSFTSKKPVPAGIDITNTDYWVNTGNYNAQVEQYRREVATIKGQFQSVKDYGAVGDGVTDDTAAFRAALSDGNKRIYIPEGSYKITGTVELFSNTTIICRGSVTHRVNAGNWSATFEAHNKENIKIVGLKMVGTGAVSGEPVYSCMVYFDGCDNVSCVDCIFLDNQSADCVCFNDTDNVRVEGCYIDQYSRIGIECVGNTNDVYIVNNTVLDCINTVTPNTYGISLSGYRTALTTGAPMPKNLNALFNYVKDEIPHWEGIEAHGGDGIKIIGNTVIGTHSGINLNSSTGNNYNCYNSIVSNNYIELGTNTAYARQIQNLCIAVSGDNVIVTGNVCKNGGVLNASLGNVDDVSSFYCVNVKGGVFADNTLTNAKGNIFDIRNCTGLDIKNNHFDSCEGFNGTNANWVFYLHGSNTNGVIIANDNTATNLTNMKFAYYSDANQPNSYINLLRNNFEGVEYITQSNLIMPMESVSSLTMGRVGDILIRSKPVAGSPLGWVCTKDWVNGAGGVWTALPNL
mgnify:CR=1 FL=1